MDKFSDIFFFLETAYYFFKVFPNEISQTSSFIMYH